MAISESEPLEVAKVTPIGGGYTVSVGSLGVKLFEMENDAADCAKAINHQISGVLRELQQPVSGPLVERRKSECDNES